MAQLSANVDDLATVPTVDAQGAVGANYRVGDEIVRLKGQRQPVGSATWSWLVSRGQGGSTAASHLSGAALTAVLSIAPSGDISISSGGSNLVLQPDGVSRIDGPEFQFGGQVRANNLPYDDPLDGGRFWQDANGFVKVSAG